MNLITVLRIAQLLLAGTVLGLSSYVANWYNSDTLTASPSQINFLLLASTISVVAIAYIELTPRFTKWTSHPYAVFALEVLVTIFYFAGFIALSVFLSRLRFCRGSVCSAARADAVFAALSFVVWNLTALLFGMALFKGGFRAAQGNIAQAKAMTEKGTA